MTRPERELTEAMFEEIRARTDWPIDDGECLWGYFFADPDRAKLEAAARLLEARGYSFVEILGDGPDAEDGAEPEPPMLHLHVERVEHHSVDTLMAREEQLREFARKWGLERYDGMDVGPAPSPLRQ